MRRWPVLTYMAGVGTLYLLCAGVDLLGRLKAGGGAQSAVFPSAAWSAGLAVLALGLMAGVARRSVWGLVCFSLAAILLGALAYQSGQTAILILNAASLAGLAGLMVTAGLRRT